MNKIPRKKVDLRSRKNQAALETKEVPDGLSFQEGRSEAGEGALPSYFGDYRPRYEEPLDIYEKAKSHARIQKKKTSKKEEKIC